MRDAKEDPSEPRIACPHCQGEQELTEVGQQICTFCGEAFTVDEIPIYESGTDIGPQVLPTGEEVTVQDYAATYCPWEDRRQIGFWKAFFEQFKWGHMKWPDMLFILLKNCIRSI